MRYQTEKQTRNLSLELSWDMKLSAEMKAATLNTPWHCLGAQVPARTQAWFFIALADDDDITLG